MHASQPDELSAILRSPAISALGISLHYSTQYLNLEVRREVRSRCHFGGWFAGRVRRSRNSAPARKPAMNKTEIVFSYAGDLWTVSRQGGAGYTPHLGRGFETDAGLLARWQHPRVFRRIRRQHRCLHRRRHRRRAQAHHLPSRRRSRGGLDPRRQGRSSSAPTAELFAITRSFSPSRPKAVCPRRCRCPWRARAPIRPMGNAWFMPPLDGGQFAPGFTNFVAWKRYRGGEASYIWMVNFADLTTQKVPAHRLQRHLSHVDRRQDLLPLRPQRPHDAVPLRPAEQKGGRS